MKNRFFIMRHAQSDHNIGSWISGDKKTDLKSKLTKVGIQQAHRLGCKLQDIGIDVIYRSPFQRVGITADIVAAYVAAPIFVDERLRQLDCGIFNGKTWAEREQFFANHFEKLYKPSPRGESLVDCKVRMAAALQDINSRHEGKNILLISHGNPLRMLQVVALNLPDAAALTDQRALRWKSDVSPDPFFDELIVAEELVAAAPS